MRTLSTLVVFLLASCVTAAQETHVWEVAEDPATLGWSATKLHVSPEFNSPDCVLSRGQEIFP